MIFADSIVHAQAISRNVCIERSEKRGETLRVAHIEPWRPVLGRPNLTQAEPQEKPYEVAGTCSYVPGRPSSLDGGGDHDELMVLPPLRNIETEAFWGSDKIELNSDSRTLCRCSLQQDPLQNGSKGHNEGCDNDFEKGIRCLGHQGAFFGVMIILTNIRSTPYMYMDSTGLQVLKTRSTFAANRSLPV